MLDNSLKFRRESGRLDKNASSMFATSVVIPTGGVGDDDFKPAVEVPKDKEKVNVKGKMSMSHQGNLDCFLMEATNVCSLHDFYAIDEIYARNEECKVLGLLVRVKLPELRKFYRRDQYQNEPKRVLQFYRVESKYKTTKLYQIPLENNEKVTHCSVCDKYATYEIVSFNGSNTKIQGSKITVVNFETQCHITLPNPFVNEMCEKEEGSSSDDISEKSISPD